MIYPWQAEIWRNLVDAMPSVPQALILAGQAGIGKRAFAKALAGMLLCQQPLEDKACGQCRACALLQADSHPDLLFIEPEEKSNTIKVDQIRHLCTALSQKAQQGSYRVAVIDALDALTHAGANSSLKTLEEPADQVVLILLYHQTVPLMPTIATRCQKIRFQTPVAAESLSWLSDQLVSAGSDQSAERLLRFASGAPLRALAMADTEQMVLAECLFRLLMGKALPDDEGRVLGFVKSLGLGVVLDVWMCLLGGVFWEGGAFSQGFLSDFWGVLLGAKRDLMRGGGSLNGQLQYEALLVRWVSGVRAA